MADFNELVAEDDPFELTGTGPIAAERGQIRGRRLATEPASKEAPDFGNVLGAAFRTENSVGSLLAHGPTKDIELDPIDEAVSQSFDAYNPLDDVPSKYVGMSDGYVGLRSPEEVEAYTTRLDAEMKDRELLAASGWQGVVSSIAAGTLDPIMLPLLAIPIANVAAVGGKVAASAGRVALAGAAGATGSEIALHATQETRTGLESAFNIAGATLLSGVLGAAASKLSRGQYDDLAKTIEREFAEVEEFAAPRSVGAAEVAKTTIEEETLLGAAGLEKLLADVNPLLRMANSPSNASRRTVQSLAENPFYTQKNLEGKASSVAVETLIKAYDARTGFAFENMDSLYVKYRTGVKGGLAKRVGIGISDMFGARRRSESLSNRQFREEIGKAMRRGDSHEIPEVAAAAKLFRKHVFNPSKDDAIELGLLPEGVTARGAESYLSRVYNTELIKARPTEFQAIISKWVGGEVDRVNQVKSKTASDSIRDIAQGKGKSIDEVDEVVAEFESILAGKRQPEGFSAVKPSPIEDEIPIPDIGQRPESAFEFLSRIGGVKDSAGELASRDLGKRGSNHPNPKFGPAFRKKGKHDLDSAREAAQEAGYVNPSTNKMEDINDFLGWVDEIHGNKESPYRFPVHEQDHIANLEMRKLIDIDNSAIRKRNALARESDIAKGQVPLSALSRAEITPEKISEMISKAEKEVLSQAEIDEVASSVMNNILGHPAGRIPFDIVPKAGPLKERVLTINDDLIQDFLESDIEMIAQYYNRTMAPEIELTRRFGSRDLKEEILQIGDEYDVLIKKAKNEKQASKLNDLKVRDIRDTEALRDLLLGTYAQPADPSSFFVRAGRTVREINYLRLLGGMTISATPDLARPVMVHGFRRVGKGLLSMAKSPSQFKMAMKDVKSYGAAWDMVMNTRAKAIGDVGDHYRRGTWFEKGTKSLSDTFGVPSIMAPWNAALKQFSGVITSNRILEESINTAAGKINKNNIKKLAMLGIDESLAKRISKEFGTHGEKGDVLHPHSNLWKDRQAAQVFEAAVLKEVDIIIVTPGIGDRPLMMSTEMGKTVGQFKSFAFAASNRMMIAGLQQKDAAALNGALLSVALGSVVYGAKQTLAGRDISDDPSVVITEAVDRSGLLGYLTDVNNIVEKATRGVVGTSALTGGPQMSRYASRNMIGALLGPTVGTIEDMRQVLGAISTGDIKNQDVHAMRKLLPYQNVFYIRGIMDEAEKNIAKQVVTKGGR